MYAIKRSVSRPFFPVLTIEYVYGSPWSSRAVTTSVASLNWVSLTPQSDTHIMFIFMLIFHIRLALRLAFRLALRLA